MRRYAGDLAAFYAKPLGRAVTQAVRPHLARAWGEAAGLDLLGLGYAAPFLEGLDAARRTVLAMPARQGAHAWPAQAPNASALVAEPALPFANAFFDRILAAHLLEEAQDAAAWLREAERVLAPSGRLLCLVAARSGAWARAEATPFGHGRPFSRTQLAAALREARLEPTSAARLLFAPPLAVLAPAAGAFEAAGAWTRAPVSGLILVEAVKRAFAPRASGRRAPVRTPGVLVPAPVRA